MLSTLSKEKTYITGRRGKVEYAFVRSIQKHGVTKIFTFKHLDLDLAHQVRRKQLFAKEKPRQIYLNFVKGPVFIPTTPSHQSFRQTPLGSPIGLVWICKWLASSFINGRCFRATLTVR